MSAFSALSAGLPLIPRSAGSTRPLKGSNQYRLRIGDWRAIYTLHDDVLMVLVVRIGHRGEVYR